MKKTVRLSIAVAVVVCVLLICLFTSMNSQLQSTRRQLAERNLAAWNDLAVMTLHIENMLKEEDVNLEAVAVKQNTAIYIISYNLSPTFPDSFLTTVYDQFLQDTLISYNDSTQAAERIALFGKANTELRTLCTDVLDLLENDNQAKLALINEKSELYATVSEKINAFCEKYQEKF